MIPRNRILARGLAIATGAGWAVAAGITISRALSGAGFLRSFRWPLYSAEAAILALIGLMIIVGASAHPAGLAAAFATIVAIMIAKHDSESGLAPLVGIAAALLAILYVRVGLGSIRLLSVVRVAMLATAVFFACVAVARMEEPAISMDWQRIRATSGTIELRRYVSDGNCLRRPPSTKDIAEIDSGCAESIPRLRGVWMIVFATASAALVLAALSTAPRLRRLLDGTEVPAWM